MCSQENRNPTIHFIPIAEQLPIFASASTRIGFHSLNKAHHPQVYLLDREEKPIKSISWNKDGTSIAVVPNSGYVEIGTLNEGGNIKFKKFEAIKNPVCAAFPNNAIKEIAIANESGDVKLYDLESGNDKQSLIKSSSIIKKLQYNKTDSHLAAACMNGQIIVYDSKRSNVCSFYRIPNCNNVSTIIFHRNVNSLLAAGSADGLVSIWDVETDRNLLNIEKQQSSITCLLFHPKNDKDLLFIANSDKTVKFYDICSRKYVGEKSFGYIFTAMDMDPSGTYWGAGTSCGYIIIYALRNLRWPIALLQFDKDNQINHFLFQKQMFQTFLFGSVYEMTEEETNSDSESFCFLEYDDESISSVGRRDLASNVNAEMPSDDVPALPSTTATSASTSLQNLQVNQSTFTDLKNILMDVVKTELEACRVKIIEDVQRLNERLHSGLHDIKKFLNNNAINLNDG